KTWATQTQLSTNTHYTTGGVNYRSANISRHIWEAGVGGSSFEGGADVMWFEEDTTLTTGDAYQIYYGRIPKVVVGVKDEKPVGVLGRFELAQNYPNPFNAATRIDFSIPERGDVYLAIYNLLGQRIATLVNKKMNAGSHSLTWNGTDDRGESVASGIYFYKLESKDRVQARKLVLMK
ncbi:MAG: T9SS type A sorting domain-containing protein, partial [Fidelibacterota bacterium]